MSRVTLRRIRRLKAEAAPAIAELARHHQNFKTRKVSWAASHLMAIVAIFRYGEPRIDEALNHAYERALKALPGATGNRSHTRAYAAFAYDMLLALEKEQCGTCGKLVELVGEVPDWLRYYCQAGVSLRMLGYPAAPFRESMHQLVPPPGDAFIWPSLPMNKLKRCPDGGEGFSFLDQLSFKDLVLFFDIMKKPDDERTRSEHKFVREIFAHHLPDGVATSHSMVHEADCPDIAGNPSDEKKDRYPPRPLYMWLQDYAIGPG